MKWETHTIRRCRAILLATLITAIGIGGLYLSLKTVYSSELSPAVITAPHKQARQFIGLPSVGTVRLQNVYNTSVQVELEFVEPGVQVREAISDTLPAASGRTYAKPADLEGFAKIRTDLQVQAVNFDLDEVGNSAYLGVNLGEQDIHTISVQNAPASARAGPTAYGNGTYEISIALLMKDSEGWYARFSLQQPQDSGFEPVLTIRYFDQSGFLKHQQTKFLRSEEFFAVDLAEIDELPSGFVGSAQINSTHELQVASSVQLYNDELNLQSAYRAQSPNDPETPPVVVPALFKQADLQTSQLCVQNIDANSSQINVVYSDGETASQLVKPNSTHCFDQGDEAHADGWIGGAVITSDDVNLSTVVVVDAIDQNKAIGRWVYAADGSHVVDAQQALAFPLLNNDYQGWTTAIHLTNYGKQATTVTPHYNAQSGFVPCVEPFELGAGKTRTLTQADLPAQFNLGSAYFTSTLPVAAVVSAVNNGPLGSTDRHFGYSAAYLESLGTPAEECTVSGYVGLRPLDEQYWSYQRGYYMGIGAPAMWARGLTGIQALNPVTVAVIDTGVDLDHPDLVDNLVSGYDFVDEDSSPDDTSLDSHGTKVAGIIAARMNNTLSGGKAMGVAGIGGGNAQSNTPGLRLMPLRIAAESGAGAGGATCERSASAIDYAIAHGARIINISYGSITPCDEEKEAIERAYAAGLIIVAGAGNKSSTTEFYPAAYGAGENDDLVLAVAGLEPSGAKALPSNYGDWIDFAAPYHQIRSLTNEGGYASDDGTSFSAPLVSGLLGVLISNSDWSRADAIAALRATADNVDAANHEQYHGLLGAGRINSDRASADLVTRYFVPIVVLEAQ